MKNNIKLRVLAAVAVGLALSPIAIHAQATSPAATADTTTSTTTTDDRAIRHEHHNYGWIGLLGLLGLTGLMRKNRDHVERYETTAARPDGGRADVR
jgi:hypothetical protein